MPIFLIQSGSSSSCAGWAAEPAGGSDAACAGIIALTQAGRSPCSTGADEANGGEAGSASNIDFDSSKVPVDWPQPAERKKSGMLSSVDAGLAGIGSAGAGVEAEISKDAANAGEGVAGIGLGGGGGVGFDSANPPAFNQSG